MSFLELLTGVLILGVLAGWAMPAIFASSDAAKVNACYVNKGEVELQIQLWRRNKNTWPAANLGDVAADINYFPEGMVVCPVDNLPYTMNPTTHRVSGHNH